MALPTYALILSIILLTSLLEAQPSTYFPHHVGDMWEYFVLDGVGNDTLQVRVVFDSTDPSGSSHVRHHRQLLNPTRPPWFPWYDVFRIDTNNNVFGSGFLPPNSLVYRLDAHIGQWWFVYYQGGAGGDVAKILGEYPDTVFGRSTTLKEIGYFSAGDTSDTTIWLWQYTDLIAEGFGTIFRGGGDLGYNLYLRGCVIDGVVYGDTIVVSVAEAHNEELPNNFIVYQNYPNPFNPETRIKYQIPYSNFATLKVYDVLGRELATLVDEVKEPGTHEVTWDARGHASGVHFGTLKTPNGLVSKKMILLK